MPLLPEFAVFQLTPRVHFRWKEAMEKRMEEIEIALERDTYQSPRSNSVNTNWKRPEGTSTSLHGPETPSEIALNLSCSLGAFPASSMTSLTFDDGESSAPRYRPDLISCGLISLEAAENHFSFYQRQLDPCIYHVLESSDCLANIRARSSVLTAAICTVAAYCTDSRDYRKCFHALITEVSGKVFAGSYTFDDVRALCISSFWLNQVSSALSGLGECSVDAISILENWKLMGFI
jgi:hypothetical protein